MKRTTKKAEKPKKYMCLKKCGKQAVYMKRNQKSGEMEHFCAECMGQIRHVAKEKAVKSISKAKQAAEARAAKQHGQTAGKTAARKRTMTRKKTT